MKVYTNEEGVKFTSFSTEMEDGLKEQAFEIAGKLKNAKVVLMPDAHVGHPAPIGLTVDFSEVAPENRYDVVELVGSDIGCGVTSRIISFSRKLTTKELEKIYSFIEKNIPIFTQPVGSGDTYGTLGSGNHFIELGEINESGAYLLTVHSGSRAEGARVYKEYRKGSLNTDMGNTEKTELLYLLKKVGLQSKIQEILDEGDFGVGIMSDEYWWEYLKEMDSAVYWANSSRQEILFKIEQFIYYNILNFSSVITINNTHNFFDRNRTRGGGVLRKGAIPQTSNYILTPLSMKEGVLVSLPMPSEENNDSAMHGAGRKLSRKLARETISIEKFEKDMLGIVAYPREETLDEAPDAYKTKETIVNDSNEICLPLFVAKPVLNFKGADRKYDKK